MRTAERATGALIFVLAGWAIVLIYAFPMFWMLSTSLRPQTELFDKAELATLSDILAKSNCAAKPFAAEPFVAKAGEIDGANVLSEMLQRVVINGESTAGAVVWAHDQVETLMSGF